MVATYVPGPHGPIVFAAGSSFSGPASLTGLKFWVKSDTGIFKDLGSTAATVDGDAVRQWNDQSGNGYNVTCNLSKEAVYKTGILNAKPAIRFDGANTGFATGVSTVALGGTTLSLYMVGMASAADAAFGRLVSFLANGQAADHDNTGSAVIVFHNTTSDHAEAFRNSGALSTGAITDGTYYQLFSVFDGTNNTVYISGVGQTAQANTSTFAATGQISLGAFFTSGALGSSQNNLAGDILEVVITNTASSTDRSNMASYFNSRYGI